VEKRLFHIKKEKVKHGEEISSEDRIQDSRK